MKPNKKQRLLMILLVFLLITGGVYLLYYLHRPKDLNVILITIDALMPDHLGCYECKRNTLPNINKLAREGVIFIQAIAQASHTLDSVPPLINSTYSYMHPIDYKEHSVYLNPIGERAKILSKITEYIINRKI